MEQQIVLDDKSFKALSAESRVNILKNLNERRMTLSELSKKLDLEASTVKEHCLVLSHANLIEQIDEGRKWKYYELTDKGKKVMMPSLMEEVKVLIVLCLGLVIFAGILFMGIQGNLMASANTGANEAPILTTQNAYDSTTTTKELTGTNIQQPPLAQITDYGINNSFVVATAIFTLIVGIIFGWGLQKAFIKRRI